MGVLNHDILESMIDTYLPWLLNGLPKIGLAILILVVGTIMGKFFGLMIRRIFERRSFDPGMGGFLSSFISSAIVFLVWISVLSTLGIQAASFIAVIGAFGLALSLAFQGSLANIAGGFMTLFFRPFTVGDFIEIGGKMGTVTEISMMYTYLETPDNRRLIIPNSQMSNTTVVNHSENPTCILDLTFSIPNSEDPDSGKRVLAQVLDHNLLVLPEPRPIIGVTGYGVGGFQLVTRFHCRRQDLFLAGLVVKEEVKNAFDLAGLTITFS